jgi:hypothetical protein
MTSALPLLIVASCGLGATFYTVGLGGWLVATWAGWLLGEHRAPIATIIPFFIALAVALFCVVLAQDPAFWSAP